MEVILVQTFLTSTVSGWIAVQSASSETSLGPSISIDNKSSVLILKLDKAVTNEALHDAYNIFS